MVIRNFCLPSGFRQPFADKIAYSEKLRNKSILRNFAICSERGLRGAKTKLKVSGQFESIEAAANYARLRSYIETCRRNGINEITALER